MNQSYPDVFGDFIEKLCESMADVGLCEDCEHAYPRNEMRDGKCFACNPLSPEGTTTKGDANA